MITEARNRWSRLKIAGGVFGIMISACTGSETPVSVEEETIRDPLVSVLQDMGFDADGIVDEGAYFRVEGDIIFSKAELKGLKPSQWRTTNLVSQTKAASIKVDLSGLTVSNWKPAAQAAITAWNNIPGSKIRFIEVTSGADIRMVNGATAEGVAAQTGFPTSSGNPANLIVFSTHPFFTAYTFNQKARTVAHEMGHTVGLRHSNWNLIGESASPYGATVIGVTPQNDTASIFRGNATPSDTPVAFSFWDAEAIKVLYPILPILSVTYVNNHPSLSWTSVPTATFKVKYLVSSCTYSSQIDDWICTEGSTIRTTTTGTSFLDTGINFTGTSNCDPNYLVTVTFQGGTPQQNTSNRVYVLTGPTTEICQ